VSDEGKKLGVLSKVLHTGANDVYEVETDPEERKSFLIPAIKDCVRDVDTENGIMTIHVMEGLL
ncbi:MAG: PRC-barrel domain-containing protein, partial [Lachnospiraceae bacterium]|nr:PRC-barrel domain-containing protein [Lachnospiraceae bacterium]